MADHLKECFDDFNSIQSPRAKHEHEVVQINSLLQQCFERLRNQQPDDVSVIESEIVQYAGERKILEMSGLRDAENAYKDQVAAVLQALSDRLVATLHPSFFQHSLQAYAAGTLKSYAPDDLEQVMVQKMPHGDNSGVHQEEKHFTTCSTASPGSRITSQPSMQHDAGIAASRKRQRHNFEEEHAVSNKRIRSDTTTVSAQQRSDEQESCAVARSGRTSEPTPSSYDEEAHGDEDATKENVVLKIIDADGCLRGELKQAGLWGTERVDRILRRAIKRPVQLRRGRPFTEEHLNAIGENGVKIVSCMIQASGDVMGEQPCTYCRNKNKGPFDQCIMVDDEGFRRCGNCEWVRGRCQGASAGAETPLISATAMELASAFPAAIPEPREPSTSQMQPQVLVEEHTSPNIRTYIVGTDDTPPTSTKTKPTLFAAAESPGFTLTETHWLIHQIKTSRFTSASSSIEFWCWFEEEGSLKHVIFHNREWRRLQRSIDFDVMLKDIIEVRASVQSWRVRLVMRRQVATGQVNPPRGDVMVVFEGWQTLQNFLHFCHDQNIPVSEQEG